MIRLAVDTAFEQLSLALTCDGKVLEEFHIDERRRNASVLFQRLGEMISRAGLGPEQIDAYVVNQGPGSYTGVRIGMALVKTLAQVFQKPVIAINSLELLASQMTSDRAPFPVLLNCTRQELFVATFEVRQGKPLQLSPILLQELDDMLKTYSQEPVLLYRIISAEDRWGSGFSKLKLLSPDRPGVSAVLLDQAASDHIQNGIGDQNSPVHPLYIKKDI